MGCKWGGIAHFCIHNCGRSLSKMDTTSAHGKGGAIPTSTSNSQRPRGVLQSCSGPGPTLGMQRQCESPEVRVWSYLTASTAGANGEVQVGGSHGPLPRSTWVNLLGQLIELTRPVCSLNYCFIIKGIKGYESTARWDNQGPRQSSFCPCGVRGPTGWQVESFWFINLETPGTLSFGGFMEASLHRHDWSNHWLLIQAPWRSGGGTESANLLITWSSNHVVVSSGNHSPILKCHPFFFLIKNSFL